MSKFYKYLIAAVLVIALVIPTGMSIVKANKIPTFDIVSVVPDEVVTIQTYDFPAGKTFHVLIGRYGYFGIWGIDVGTTDSGKGGTFTATFKIPAELKGVPMLSIRLEDRVTDYYAYNWFKNSIVEVETPVAASGETTDETATVATSAPVEEIKHPSFIISSVDSGKSITIQGSDFPEFEEFNVLMGVYGTVGIGGEKVNTQKTGSKGEFSATYEIPADLKGAYTIAVRLESDYSDYYAFNYFFNTTYMPTTVTTTEASSAATAVATSASVANPIAESSYQGYPSFTVTKVTKDTTVEIDAENLPMDETFTVYVSDFNGTNQPIKVGTLDSGKAGKATGSFSIPADLKGVSQISVRLSGDTTGYFAYNYFFNKDYPFVPTAVPTATSTAAPTEAPTLVPTTVPTPAPTATPAS
jgi:hypothetical protein